MDQKTFAWDTLKFLYEKQFSNSVEKIPNSQYTKEKFTVLRSLEEKKLITGCKGAKNKEDKDDISVGYLSMITEKGCERYEKYTELIKATQLLKLNKKYVYIILIIASASFVIDIFNLF